MIQQSHSWTYIQRNPYWKMYMHPDIHCSTIYNSQDMEEAYLSNDREMDKEDVVHIHNRILLSHKKERMPFAATWVDLEIIMLNKKSEKGKYHMISFVSGIYKLKKRHKWSNFQKINWPIDFANKRTAAKGESWARSLKLTNSHYYV